VDAPTAIDCHRSLRREDFKFRVMTKRKKKSKIPRRLKKKIQERKRLKKVICNSQEKLLQRVKEQSIDGGKKFLIAPPNMTKMSEIIIDYAKPLLSVAKNDDEQKKALSIAIAIWNLSLFPKEMQSEYIGKITEIMTASRKDSQLSENEKEVLNFLMERKKTFFPEIRRVILDYEYVGTPKGFHINVVSNILKNDQSSSTA
jgi:hypothetical protein